MDEIEKTLRAYENDINAEKTIRNAVTDAYGSLKPELETIQRYENEQFPQFYNTLSSGYGMGTDAASMSPTARLGTAWGDVGRLSTNANVARGVLDVRRAGMEDLIASLLKKWELGYGGAQNAWDRAYKLRALRGSGGGYTGPINTPNIKQPIDKKALGLINTINTAFKNNIGADNRVSPDTYKYFRTVWRDNGYDVRLFDQQWGQAGSPNSFVNPSHAQDYFGYWTNPYSPKLN